MGGRLEGVPNSHLLRVQASTMSRTQVNPQIERTLMKQKSMWINSPGRRKDVSIRIPLGIDVMVAELHIQHLEPQVISRLEKR